MESNPVTSDYSIEAYLTVKIAKNSSPSAPLEIAVRRTMSGAILTKPPNLSSKLVRSNTVDQIAKKGTAKTISVQKKEICVITLANEMKHKETGGLVKDRKYRLRSYPNCFVAEEAVTWICTHLCISDRIQAVKLGQQMVDKNLISHVVCPQDLQDKYLFFRFNE